MRVLVVFVLLFVSSGSVFSEEIPTPVELCKKIYESRNGIHSARVVLEVRKPVSTLNKGTEKRVETFALYRTADKSRVDRRISFPNARETLEQHLIVPEWRIDRWPFGDVKSNHFENAFFFENKSGVPLDATVGFDPRLIGLMGLSIDTLKEAKFSYGSLAEQFLPPAASNFRVEKDNTNGRDVWKLSYQVVGNAVFHVNYWIDHQRGFNPLKFECEKPGYRYGFDVKLHKYGSGAEARWFPAEVDFQIEETNYRLHERLVVKEAVFNTVLPDECFDLSGIDMPYGYEVVCGQGDLLYWNGEKLVREKDLYRPVSPSSSGSRVVFWSVNAILLLLIAYTLWKKRRAPRTVSS